MGRLASMARLALPTDPSPHYMRLQDGQDDLKWNRRKLEIMLDECEDENDRLVIEDRLEYLRMTAQDIEMEMERYADEGYF